jgi:hypothetical protein
MKSDIIEYMSSSKPGNVINVETERWVYLVECAENMVLRKVNMNPITVTILLTFLSGILGTAGMTFVMWLINRSGLANADMMRAIGSLYTRSYENSLLPGFIIHFGVGGILAFFYTAFLSIFYFRSVIALASLGGMLGLLQGLVVSFALVALVAEHHPLEQFRKAGSEVVVAHMLGHVIYGLIVGAMIGITGINFSFVPRII